MFGIFLLFKTFHSNWLTSKIVSMICKAFEFSCTRVCPLCSLVKLSTSDFYFSQKYFDFVRFNVVPLFLSVCHMF